MYREGKSRKGSSNSHHKIHATVNNHQAKHQSIVVECLGKVNNFIIKMLFDPCATNSFISPSVADRCGLVDYKYDGFKLVDMS